MLHLQGSPIIPTLSQINSIPCIDTYFIIFISIFSFHLRLGPGRGLFPAVTESMAYGNQSFTCWSHVTPKLTGLSIISVLLYMEQWAAAKKSFKLVWRCHQLLSGFLAKGHLPRVSRQSRWSLMIRVIIKWSCAQISWHLPYSWEKPQLGDRLVKRLCDQSSPQMGSLSSKWGR